MPLTAAEGRLRLRRGRAPTAAQLVVVCIAGQVGVVGGEQRRRTCEVSVAQFKFDGLDQLSVSLPPVAPWAPPSNSAALETGGQVWKAGGVAGRARCAASASKPPGSVEARVCQRASNAAWKSGREQLGGAARRPRAQYDRAPAAPVGVGRPQRWRAWQQQQRRQRRWHPLQVSLSTLCRASLRHSRELQRGTKQALAPHAIAGGRRWTRSLLPWQPRQPSAASASR